MKAISDFKRVVLVGCGGVGTHLDPLWRYIAYKHPGTTVLLIDGDSYEEKNRERQNFAVPFGNKAEVKADELTALFPELVFAACTEYVTQDNIAELIPEDSLVICAVDNHPSRLLLSEHVSGLDNAALISGGNDYSDGNVQIHIRQNGEDITPPITYLHPEIELNEGGSKHPAEMSCEEQAAAGSPQLVLANNMVASLIAGTYWRLERAMELAQANNTPLDFPAAESYFDLTTGAVRPVKRIMQKEPSDGRATDREIAVDERGRSGGVEAATR